MKRISVSLFIIFSLCISCKKDNTDTIEIRVQNATPLQIEKIDILTGDHEIAFELLPAGFTTGYLNAGRVSLSALQYVIYIEGYQNPFIETDNAISYLNPGKYTCRVSYYNAIPTITLTRE